MTSLRQTCPSDVWKVLSVPPFHIRFPFIPFVHIPQYTVRYDTWYIPQPRSQLIVRFSAKGAVTSTRRDTYLPTDICFEKKYNF